MLSSRLQSYGIINFIDNLIFKTVIIDIFTIKQLNKLYNYWLILNKFKKRTLNIAFQRLKIINYVYETDSSIFAQKYVQIKSNLEK